MSVSNHCGLEFLDNGAKWVRVGHSGNNSHSAEKMGLKDKCLYVGEFQHNLDTKNRLTIPSKWRFNGDNDEVYLALPNPIGCISVYPPKMVAKLEEKVQEVSLGDKKAQRALTLLFSKADHFGCDKSGRIVLNENLIGHSSIDKEVMMVGNFITFNLWAPGKYEEYLNSEDSQEDDEMSKILTQLGV